MGVKRKSTAKSVGRVLLGILLVAFAIIPPILLNSLFGYLPLLMLVALVAVDAAYGRLVRGKISFDSHNGAIVVPRREDAALSLDLANDAVVPAPRVEVVLKITNAFGVVEATQVQEFALEPRAKQTIPLAVRLMHVGDITVGIESINVSGPFGLIRWTVAVNETVTIRVEPRHQFPASITFGESIVNEGATQTSVMVNEGMNYAGVREYRRGDPMKAIHWKLSSHSSEYLTKLYEVYADPGVSILVDETVATTDSELVAGTYDLLMESAIVVMDVAAKNGLNRELHVLDSNHEPVTLRNEKRLLDVVPIALESPHDIQEENLLPILGSPTMQGNVVYVSSVVDRSILDALIAVGRSGRTATLVFAKLGDEVDPGTQDTIRLAGKLGVQTWMVSYDHDGGELVWLL